jgi:hypothetical protein
MLGLHTRHYSLMGIFSSSKKLAAPLLWMSQHVVGETDSLNDAVLSETKRAPGISGGVM